MDFQIGDVVNRTFGAISRNFPVFSLLALVLVGIPTFLIGLTQIGLVTGDLSVFGFAMIAGLIVNSVTIYILQGALIHGAVVDFNGGRASFGDCLSTGIKNFLPLIAIAILMTLGVMLGMVLLIIPGIILSIMWVVAIPAQVVENSGITESFGRSAELTKGNRRKIFGLLVIYLILSTVISMAIMLPAGSFSSVGEITMVTVLFEAVASVLSAVVGAAGVSSIYYELRKAKEGVGAEALAKVFD